VIEVISIFGGNDCLYKRLRDIGVMDIFAVGLFEKYADRCFFIIIVDRAFRKNDAVDNPSLYSSGGVPRYLNVKDR
jgi:hypothetical protein